MAHNRTHTQLNELVIIMCILACTTTTVTIIHTATAITPTAAATAAVAAATAFGDDVDNNNNNNHNNNTFMEKEIKQIFFLHGCYYCCYSKWQIIRVSLNAFFIACFCFIRHALEISFSLELLFY